MKLLFLHFNTQCYLADSLFHGLRKVLGKNCVDVPRMDSMYRPLYQSVRAKLRGYGFSLYGLLEEIGDLQGERYRWASELNSFDFIVLPHIWWQGDTLRWLLRDKRVPIEKIVILDGADEPRLFPFKKAFLPHFLDLLPALRRIPYFKREAVQSLEYIGLNLPDRHWAPSNLYPLHFSIPKEKANYQSPSTRRMLMAQHAVDEEVVAWAQQKWTQRSRSQLLLTSSYPFDSESDYYHNLRNSTFAITTKRAGWDCLRHYEIASQGCIPCFRDLHLKPEFCAPFGWNEKNCISYASAEELFSKIHSLSNTQIASMQKEVSQWISLNTTEARAEQFLQVLKTLK